MRDYNPDDFRVNEKNATDHEVHLVKKIKWLPKSKWNTKIVLDDGGDLAFEALDVAPAKEVPRTRRVAWLGGSGPKFRKEKK